MTAQEALRAASVIIKGFSGFTYPTTSPSAVADWEMLAKVINRLHAAGYGREMSSGSSSSQYFCWLIAFAAFMLQMEHESDTPPLNSNSWTDMKVVPTISFK